MAAGPARGAAFPPGPARRCPARRRCREKAEATRAIGACRRGPVQERPSKRPRPSSCLSCWCACPLRWCLRPPPGRRSPTSQAFSPGRWRLSPQAGPSPTRTRTAANRAASAPSVPRRQAVRRHGNSAKTSSAQRGSSSGTGFRLRPAGGTSRTPAPQAFWLRGMPTAQCSPFRRGRGGTPRSRRSSRRPARCRSARPPPAACPPRRARSRPCSAAPWPPRARPPGPPARAARPGRPPGAALRIARPLVGQEQPQRHGDRHSAPRQGQRDQRLAVGLLAQPPAVPPRHPHRRRAPLGQRRVVGHQRRLRPAHQPVGPSGRHPPQRAVVPGRAGDKVVRLVMPRQAGAAACHRPQALALAGTEQASQAERRPGPALPVPEHVEEGSQPGFEVARRAARGRLPRRRQQARLKGERPPPSGVPRWCQRLSWTDGRCSLRG